jgi:hypothetical protein
MNGQEESLKFRHEWKHYINLCDYLCIRQKLSVLARRDSHAGADGKYRVRSLYFETPEDRALQEKLNGIGCREKFRLRYYDDDISFLRLEKKMKLNGLGNKRSSPLSKAECERLIEGDTDWMAASEDPLILELYSKMKYQQLKPKTVVDYLREPYTYEAGNVRITIDSQIETGILSRDFFNRDLPAVRAGADGVMILEVKYDAFLPDLIRDAIQVKNRNASAISKYAISRIYG